MGSGNTPVAEVDVSVELVCRLLTDQHPDLAHLPIQIVANGWDNLVGRLGDELAVRLPRRAQAADLVEHEQRWLPLLAPALPLRVPVPVRVGHPALGYPWSWSVVPFLPGTIAARTPPADLVTAAADLGRFLGALHIPAPPDAPANPVRGVALTERSAAFLTRVEQLDGVIETATVLQVWHAAVATPVWTDAPRWLHGDLHPANILVHAGRISAVIDFGDITSGDPATDLSVAWMLLPAEARTVFRDAYGRSNARVVDDDTWARARGWALALALAVLVRSADNPLMARIGRRTLAAVLDDEG